MPETQAPTPSASSPSTSSGFSGSKLAEPASALAREDAVRAAAAASEEARQADLNELASANREAARQAFEDSDAGLVARQHREAERIMKLPTPDALDELGSVVGDATQGPAS